MEWISTTDDKPTSHQCVDIWVEMPDGDHGRIADCFYYSKRKSYWSWINGGNKKGFIEECYVTHYMHLPNPPETKV